MPEAYYFANDMVAKIHQVICVIFTTEQQSLLRCIDTDVVDRCVKLCINKAVSQKNVARGVCHSMAEVVHNAGQDRVLHVTKHMERCFLLARCFLSVTQHENNFRNRSGLSITWNN